MKTPFTSTLLMGLVAAVSSVAAAYFYPWPEIPQSTELVNEPLFEDYDYNSVRTLEIAKFNRDTNALEKIVLRRSGEKWVIPSKGNFVVTRSTAISNAVNSLKERLVLEVMSDQQQDHFEYGVVDPNDHGSVTNLSGLGVQIKLLDRNDGELANLIIGKGRKNDPERLKRFVRKPGQPQVYAIDFDASVLNTEFVAWVSPNLFDVQARDNVTGKRPIALEVANYRIDPAAIATADAEHRYRALMNLEQAFQVTRLEVPDGSGSLVERPVTQLQIQELNQLGRFIANTVFTDVVRKPEGVVQAMQQGDGGPSDFSELNPFGFRRVGAADRLAFEGSRGRMSLTTEDRVQVDLYLGKPTGSLNKFTGKPDRYMMLVATVDPASFPVPEKPAEADEASDEMRAYLRAVADRDRDLKRAQGLANGLNRGYGDWFYIVDDTIADGLIPDITLTDAGPAADAGEPGENSERP